jgi:hypothetical protein
MFPPVSASGLSRKRRPIEIGQSIANQLNICPAITMVYMWEFQGWMQDTSVRDLLSF